MSETTRAADVARARAADAAAALDAAIDAAIDAADEADACAARAADAAAAVYKAASDAYNVASSALQDAYTRITELEAEVERLRECAKPGGYAVLFERVCAAVDAAGVDSDPLQAAFELTAERDALKAEVETMRVAAHELMVERDELQRTLDSLTQEYHLSKSECSERLRHGQTIEADGLATDKHDEQAR